MIAVDYDDTKILNILFDFFTFLIVLSKNSITSVRNEIF